MSKENIKMLSCGCSIVDCIFNKNAKCNQSKEQHTKEMIETSPYVHKTYCKSKEHLEKTIKIITKSNDWVIQIQNDYTIAIPAALRKSELYFEGLYAASIRWQ